MTREDWARLVERFPPSDVLVAFSVLTRLPVQVDHDAAGGRLSASIWAYPVVGLVVGLIGGAAFGLASWIGAAAGVAAAAALMAQALATGALHEDGLADTADGLGGGSTPMRRLEIMRDSTVGAFGVLALLLIVLTRWSAVSSFEVWEAIGALAAAGAASRGVVAATMWAAPPAKSDGLSASVGRPDDLGALAAIMLAVLFCFAAGFVGIVAAFVGVAAATALALAALNRIGGQTGDVLGAAQQVSEAAMLATLTALL